MHVFIAYTVNGVICSYFHLFLLNEFDRFTARPNGGDESEIAREENEIECFRVAELFLNYDTHS